MVGSSPRWRGTPSEGTGIDTLNRIIPALAGNTSPVRTCRTGCPDHPRAGGEHGCGGAFFLFFFGSSPRWRGTRRCAEGGAEDCRIIPALAGNTCLCRVVCLCVPDHPRAGGEHGRPPAENSRDSGSSPRWRGTQNSTSLLNLDLRIIPALAGNTAGEPCKREVIPDHPRAGGEHEEIRDVCSRNSGSSPRWRGTPDRKRKTISHRRIIPALAGNTRDAPPSARWSSDHPRAGGEHDGYTVPVPCVLGSSPRWRGTPERPEIGEVLKRIIPALAGNTAWPARESPVRPDHPRAGGEHAKRRGVALRCFGSSPRWRGTPPPMRLAAGHPRIIPALAGNTPFITP